MKLVTWTTFNGLYMCGCPTHIKSTISSFVAAQNASSWGHCWWISRKTADTVPFCCLWHTQTCCPFSGKDYFHLSWWTLTRHLQQTIEILQALNIVYRVVVSVYSMKRLSQRVEWKCTTNVNDFHSLFEWQLYYFCSFCKCYKAHDLFFDVVSGFNVDVYSVF